MKRVLVASLAAAATITGGGLAVDSAINPYETSDRGLVLTPTEDTVVVAQTDRPAVTLSRWDGAASLTVSYPDVEATGSRQIFSDKIAWRGDGTQSVQAYPLDSQHVDSGGFEIEVHLSERPESNVFVFPVEGHEQFDFFYQPALTAEEEAQGFSRPENVVGSYAVYHKERRHQELGGRDYKTGKAFHVYRPKVWDAVGNETWAELSFDDGAFVVTVPQKFLDTATYPVTVDPTFGYTTIGASSQSVGGSGDGDAYGNAVTGVEGTLVSISAAYRASAPANYINTYRLSNSSSAVGNIFSSSQTDSLTTSFAWYSRVASGQALSGSTLYVTADLAYGFAESNMLAYDSGIGTDGGFYDTFTSGSWNPVNTRIYSVYATYTAAPPPANAEGIIFME